MTHMPRLSAAIDDKCPNCGAALEYLNEVDIGVGILRGNPGCPECHWMPSADRMNPSDLNPDIDEDWEHHD